MTRAIAFIPEAISFLTASPPTSSIFTSLQYSFSRIWLETSQQVVTCTNIENVIRHYRHLTGQNCHRLPESIVASRRWSSIFPLVTSFICPPYSINKRTAAPFLISPLLKLCLRIALSNYPSQAGEWSNCLECNYSGSLKGGHCADLRPHISAPLCLHCRR